MLDQNVHIRHLVVLPAGITQIAIYSDHGPTFRQSRFRRLPFGPQDFAPGFAELGGGGGFD